MSPTPLSPSHPPALPTVAVVILTRNRPEMLARCLDSLRAEDPALAVVVVDNSTDNRTEALMRTAYPTAQHQRLAQTRHVLAVGRNRGAALTQSEVVAFIDDDVTVYPGWLQACRAAIATAGVGAVGGRILDPEVEHRDFFRGAPICQILPDGRILDNQECDPGRIIAVDHLRGCNWAVRRVAFEAAGRFDETWDTYAYEEFDLALRIRQAGYQLRFVPAMCLYHHLVPRQGDTRSQKTFGGVSNRSGC